MRATAPLVLHAAAPDVLRKFLRVSIFNTVQLQRDSPASLSREHHQTSSVESAIWKATIASAPTASSRVTEDTSEAHENLSL
jgi:hypothetical protein